jgi:tetraacyldisaccharide 4'-kinase
VFRKFFEDMFFYPKWYHWVVSILLLPISLLYGTLMFARRVLSPSKDFGIPIISIGNLIVGGSGKTPFVIELINRYDKVVIISRGYGRKSNGMHLVSLFGDIRCTVDVSGDEAMLMALSSKASVIVSENRNKAIEYAKELGAKVIVLDDGFGKVYIDKFDIVLEPAQVANPLTFPSGPFREFSISQQFAHLILKENIDFKRVVTYENLTSRMMLTTAIANPLRLNRFLPKGVVEKYYLDDHAYFDEEDLKEKMLQKNITSLLVTQKDMVKMVDFKLPLSLMKLKLDINNTKLQAIDAYVKEKQNEIQNRSGKNAT